MQQKSTPAGWDGFQPILLSPEGTLPYSKDFFRGSLERNQSIRLLAKGIQYGLFSREPLKNAEL
jgi:hypothetical protein